ncbi:MAG: hypothetical protein GX102_06190 [Porphyromonadaceae bacterium]|nr:hypothetical protein [Porphyromonadaceae bacterium]
MFDIEAVPEIYIETTTREWNNLLSYFDQNPKNEESIPCDFVFVKGEQRDTILNIGMRLRGNTSRRRPEGKNGEKHNPVNPDWHHVHFGLNFKKYVKGQHLRNLEKLNLKWFKDDGVYAREVYCYDLFERFDVWTSPQSSYCRLFIKIKEDNKWINYDVYQLVEPIDKEFVKNRIGKFNDSKGNLWKANWGADFVNTDRSRMGLENVTLTQTYQPVYDLKTNESNLESAKNQLVNFINNLNSKQGDEFKMWVESAMDVPLFLKTYAVNVICGMWDDYWNNTNNFYFYFDSNNKFYFIPYDYDNTLGTSLLMNDSGTQDVLNWGKSSNPLVRKIISIPEYRTLYINYLKELNDPEKDLFYYTKSMDRISKWHSMIRSYISNDTGEDMKIVDVPAGWGNCPHYRLLSTTNNYFKVRGENLP